MKRTKKITQTLRAIAKTMPDQNYHFNRTVEEAGADLIKKGITKDGDGKAIREDKKYLKRTPVANTVNHENRMKSAFDGNGWDGVKSYIKPLIKPEFQAQFFTNLDLLIG